MTELSASVSMGAMPALLRKLDAFLSGNCELRDDVQNDFRFLRAELDAMDTFLRRMSKVEEHGKQTQCQLVLVRDLSYDIEDHIDKLMLLDSSDTGEITSKIRAIMELVNEVKESHSKYSKQIDDEIKAISCKIPTDPRPHFLYADESELVGIEVLMDDLIFMLTCGEDEGLLLQRIVSIVGFGGSAKSTLAKKLYHDLGPQFDCRAFVSVSRKPNIRWTLRSLLCQIRDDLCAYAEAWDENQLIDEIMDFLQDKRYFIVVDDIWSTDAWADIECIFIENGFANRVITTTRKIDVANRCATHEVFVYKIGPLTALGSQKLLFKRLGWNETCPAELSEACEEIIEKCGGLPLAVVALSSLLASNPTKDGWNQVRDSIFSAAGSSYDIEIMRRVFCASYVDLPQHLKTCLLYMATFPVNDDISKVHLVNKWIAEGFVCSENGEDPHELGERYLNELINRSLIKCVKTRYDGKIGSCRILPIIRDFLGSIAMEENFASSVSSSNDLTADNKARRISLAQSNNEGNAVISPSLITSHLRSLTVFGPFSEILPHLSSFKFLRVLDLRYCDVLENHHLTNIGEVFLLRYLNISGTGVSVLPVEIGDLQFLETLDASYSKVKELPSTVPQLRRLVHLHVPQGTRFPEGLARLRELQDLEHVDVFGQSVSFLHELDQLTNLRKLSITLDYSKMNQGNECYKEMLLSSLNRLEKHNRCDLSIKLDLANEGDISVDSWRCHCQPGRLRNLDIHAEGVVKVPDWFTSKENISALTLAVKDMDRNDLQVVGHIPNLLHFSLGLRDPDPESSSVIVSSSHGFQKLKHFIFHSSCELLFGDGSMPNVVDVALFIDASSCLRSACGIRNLSSLENIGVLLIGPEPSEVRASGDAFKSAVAAHPKRPTLEIYSWAMAREEEEEDQEEERRLRRCIRRSGFSRIQEA